MSRTFAPQHSPIVGWAVTNMVNGREEFALDQREAAVQRVGQARNTGPILRGSDPDADEFWCRQAFVVPVESDPTPSVQVTNAHAEGLGRRLAITVCDTEGIEVPGALEPSQFLARVLTALDRENDPDDYYRVQLVELRDLTRWAITNGRTTIGWT